jgi:hypothetical protein
MKSFSRLTALLALVCTAGSLGAQAVLKDLRFTPPTFFVGDQVSLLIEFDVTGPLSVEPPASIPQADWIEIRSIDIQEGSGTLGVLISFIPFAPGTRALPDMDLGALRLTDIKIPTYSILQNTHEGVRSLRGQLLVPGTRLTVALILAFAAMAPFMGYGLIQIVWKKVRQFRERFRFNRPERKIRRLLKKLGGVIGSVSAPDWYSELTDGLREYLSSRTQNDCRSSTTAEIAHLEVFQNGDIPGNKLISVLRDGDMVKFAGRFADGSTMRNTLQEVERTVEEWGQSHAQL